MQEIFKLKKTWTQVKNNTSNHTQILYSKQTTRHSIFYQLARQ